MEDLAREIMTQSPNGRIRLESSERDVTVGIVLDGITWKICLSSNLCVMDFPFTLTDQTNLTVASVDLSIIFFSGDSHARTVK